MNLSTVKMWAVKPATARAGFYALGFGVGFGTGAWYTRRVMAARYEQILEEEVQKTKNFYKTLYDKGEMPVTEQVVEEYEEVENVVKPYSPPRTTDDGEVRALGDEPEEEKTYSPVDENASYEPLTEEEIQGASWHTQGGDERTAARADAPYLITEPEFRENLVNHRQAEWTYYEEDGAIVDETETKIHKPEEVLGAVDLYGSYDDLSDDGVTLYFRNEKLELDILLTIDYGSWEKQQLAYEEERSFRHEDQRRAREVRKFRSDDG